MKKNNTLVMLLFSSAMIVALFVAANLMISDDVEAEKKDDNIGIIYEDINDSEPWLLANPSDQEEQEVDLAEGEDLDTALKEEEVNVDDAKDVVSSNSLEIWKESQLINDCTEIDYYSYVPDTVIDSKIEVALDIINPNINLEATAAILIDADTEEVLFYKNPVEAVFPASTSKLLSSLVTLDWCQEDEEVVVGQEVKFMASDSSKANIKEGQVLSVRNILEGMLIPSGNDAAYVAAAYVGRKSLEDPQASGELAVGEFVRLMNEKAKSLNAINSCFKTPDGYDAIGQYTTAYDMGLIGLAAAENETILEISNEASSRNIFPSGEDITWRNTNALISKDSGRYYPYAKGLKTGTSTMAGRCLITYASNNGKNIICVILGSTSTGRYDDTIALLDYSFQ